MKKMKTLVLLLSMTAFLSLDSMAQVDSEDFGRIVLNTHLADELELPAEASKLLINKLDQITSINGIGGSQANPRFIITADVNVGTKDIIAGAPQMIAQNLEVTFFIADAIAQVVFNSTSVSLKGVGTNDV